MRLTNAECRDLRESTNGDLDVRAAELQEERRNKLFGSVSDDDGGDPRTLPRAERDERAAHKRGLRRYG